MEQHIEMSPTLMRLVAERFKGLAEPARLELLAALRAGEQTVTELVEATGLGQANLSKHLRQLHALGFVRRRRDGLHVRYELADDGVFELCDLMCGRLALEAEARRRLFES